MNQPTATQVWPGAVVYLKDPKSEVWPEKTLTLERATFAILGNVTFLTGFKPASTKPHWCDNTQVWLAMDEIKSMCVWEDSAKWLSDRDARMNKWREQGYDV